MTRGSTGVCIPRGFPVNAKYIGKWYYIDVPEMGPGGASYAAVLVSVTECGAVFGMYNGREIIWYRRTFSEMMDHTPLMSRPGMRLSNCYCFWGDDKDNTPEGIVEAYRQKEMNKELK